MNEITKIHLGRQPFVIAVDAYKILQTYLHDIKRQVGKNGEGVIDEVEVRMAELLAERGVRGDKVVLLDDVEYLKQQLGAPRDFKGDDDTIDSGPVEEQAEPGAKRLFRDAEHGMLAGVSSGLAAYFGVDAVVFRILFVIATLTGGWGIPLYIIMWLIMPEAKSASDRLQMRGKAVTVDSLKEVVDRADVTGAAHRASRSLVAFIETVGRVLLAVVGISFIVGAVAVLAGIATLGVYALLHQGHLLHGVLQFPVGVSEAVVTIASMVLVAVTALFLLLAGVAMVRRKWAVPGWAVAALAGIFLVSIVAGTAALPDTVNSVQSRYEAAQHTEVRKMSAFERVRVQAGPAPMAYRYEQSDTYSVELHYLGDVDTKEITTAVTDKTLTVDTRSFHGGRDWDCTGMCVGPSEFMEVVIRAPMSYYDLQAEDGGITGPVFYSPDYPDYMGR